jgi:atypical dual specificity phosphatase
MDYAPIGKRIIGTRFIAFKVPLTEHVCQALPADERFTLSDLVRTLEDMDEQLGLVIDLTNTTRYYQKEDVMKLGIGYRKIFTEGHQVPSKAVCQNFFNAVDDYLKSDDDNKALIGVHCTHGLNRTGYLVCRYMIDKLSFTPDKAIEAFNDARGHAMERENYLMSLRSRASCSRDSCDERQSAGSKTSSAVGHQNSRQGKQGRRSRTRDPYGNQQSNPGYHAGQNYQEGFGPEARNWRERRNERHSELQNRPQFGYGGSYSQMRYGYGNGSGYGNRGQQFWNYSPSDDYYGRFGHQTREYNRWSNGTTYQQPKYQHSTYQETTYQQPCVQDSNYWESQNHPEQHHGSASCQLYRSHEN